MSMPQIDKYLKDSSFSKSLKLSDDQATIINELNKLKSVVNYQRSSIDDMHKRLDQAQISYGAIKSLVVIIGFSLIVMMFVFIAAAKGVL